MTREEQLQQLESLLDCVVDIGLAGEVIPSAGKDQLPSLKVEIPTGEEDSEPREMVCTFLPIDEDKTKFTKLLQMYMELPTDLPEESAPMVMLLMHQMNQVFAVGQCFWRMGDRSSQVFSRIGVRYTLATPIDQEVDEGCFCECMLLLADAFDFLNQILDAAQDTEKAKELLRQMQEVLEEQLRQVQEEAGAAEQDNDASLEHRDSEPAEDAGPQELGDDELENISGGGPSGRHSRRR